MQPKCRRRDKSFCRARFAGASTFEQVILSRRQYRRWANRVNATQETPHRLKLVTDPVTGLPALSAGPNAPTLSSKEVEEMLANFP